MSEVSEFTVKGAGCRLSVKVSGPVDGPVLVLLHGMRDHADSMRVLTDVFPEYRVIRPDLRGHGDSDNPGVYGFLHFVADLSAVLDHFDVEQCCLVGHSLGGHICSRYSSLYPEQVSHLVLLDGMGPPDEQGDEARAYSNDQWRRSVSLVLSEPQGRTLASVEAASEKLLANNPGLSEERARTIAESGVTKSEAGFSWKWDSRVDSIWSTFSHTESEASLPLISCPVLVVTGDRALDYWAERREALAGQLDFYQSELERREKLFRKASSCLIPDAGHMLHYDQPTLVARAIRDFLFTAG